MKRLHDVLADCVSAEATRTEENLEDPSFARCSFSQSEDDVDMSNISQHDVMRLEIRDAERRRVEFGTIRREMTESKRLALRNLRRAYDREIREYRSLHRSKDRHAESALAQAEHQYGTAVEELCTMRQVLEKEVRRRRTCERLVRELEDRVRTLRTENETRVRDVESAYAKERDAANMAAERQFEEMESNRRVSERASLRELVCEHARALREMSHVHRLDIQREEESFQREQRIAREKWTESSRSVESYLESEMSEIFCRAPAADVGSQEALSMSEVTIRSLRRELEKTKRELKESQRRFVRNVRS